MSLPGHPTRGFTLTEMSVATLVFTISTAMALSGFTYVLRAGQQRQIQNELDIDVQKAMERIRHDLRLSSLNEAFFYPAGAGPYTAISFPMARDDDGDGAVEVDENGEVIWDRTLVYHVWQGDPTQLRLTVFDPRDNTLTDVQRQAQIDSVVANGNGSAAPNGAHAQTRVVFENLFTWTISPEGATYDAYASALSRDVGVVLGSVPLDTGSHVFRFDVIGKNSQSSGYKVGADNFFVSPSYGAREGEAQLPVTQQSGAAAVAELMSGGSWDGNYQLSFPATGAGQYFTLTMNNDRWEETNFRQTGSIKDNVQVLFDSGLTPNDFVVALEGYGYNWNVTDQTADPVGGSSGYDQLRGCAVRLLMRGEEMAYGNWIPYDGGNVIALFRGSSVPGHPEYRFTIREVHIAECADHETPTPDVVASTDKKLRFWNGSAWADGMTIENGSSAWAYYPATGSFPIEKEKSYIVSFLVADVADQGTCHRWADRRDATTPSAYIIPRTNAPTAADLVDATWSDRADIITSTNLFSFQYLYTSLPTNGFFESGPFDTQLAAPAFSSMSWNAQVPSGCSLKMKVRTDDHDDMSGATAWSNVTAMTSGGAISPGSKRYVQFRAEMTPDSTFWGSASPKLKDVTIQWTGEKRMVDVGGTFTKGPNYGIFKLSVDGNPIKTGVTIDLEIFKDTRGFVGTKRMTSSLVSEVRPRNTGN